MRGLAHEEPAIDYGPRGIRANAICPWFIGVSE